MGALAYFRDRRVVSPNPNNSPLAKWKNNHSSHFYSNTLDLYHIFISREILEFLGSKTHWPINILRPPQSRPLQRNFASRNGVADGTAIWKKWKIVSYFFEDGLEVIFKKYNKIKLLYRQKRMAYFLRQYEIVMLTRYEILKELRRMGVKETCLLKAYLRDFENYIGTHYGLEIVKTKKKLDDSPNPEPSSLYKV